MHDGSIRCDVINVMDDVTANVCNATADVVLVVAVVVSGVVGVVRSRCRACGRGNAAAPSEGLEPSRAQPMCELGSNV